MIYEGIDIAGVSWLFVHSISENSDVGSPRLNITHVNTAFNQEVARESPSSSPGVADNPVRSSRNGSRGRSGAVTNNNNGVIDVVFISNNTSWIAVDTGSFLKKSKSTR